MSIRIVTDSTCDLPESIATAYGISVIPMLIQIGAETYQDGVEMTRRSFYECLPDCDPYPTTVIPPVDVFHQAYERLADNGATDILSIHISLSLSTVFDVAHMAAKGTRAAVTVFDSRQVSLGMGFQVEAAAREAAQGRSVEQIVQILKEQTARTHVVAVLDMFEYLQRSGRVSRAVAGLGQMLRFKPLLHIYNGEAMAEGLRTREGATNRLVQILTELRPLERFALLHSNAAERAEELRHKAKDLLPEGDIPVVDITPVIGVHTGPGMVGFACIAREA
jgi:DegV family protein with EDD domain